MQPQVDRVTTCGGVKQRLHPSPVLCGEGTLKPQHLRLLICRLMVKILAICSDQHGPAIYKLLTLGSTHATCPVLACLMAIQGRTQYYAMTEGGDLSLERLNSLAETCSSTVCSWGHYDTILPTICKTVGMGPTLEEHLLHTPNKKLLRTRIALHT